MKWTNATHPAAYWEAKSLIYIRPKRLDCLLKRKNTARLAAYSFFQPLNPLIYKDPEINRLPIEMQEIKGAVLIKLSNLNI